MHVLRVRSSGSRVVVRGDVVRGGVPRRGVVSHVDFRQRLQVVNPATKQVLSVVEPTTKDTIASRVRRQPPDLHLTGLLQVNKTKRAQKEWAATSMLKRKEAIAQFGQLLRDNQEDLAASLTQETGKPITQARNEIIGAALFSSPPLI